jgi:hypothetical protein
MANLFLLKVMGIIAISAAQNHRSWKARMAKLAMRAFASRHGQETRFDEFGNQLADFTQHQLGFQYHWNRQPSNQCCRSTELQASTASRIGRVPTGGKGFPASWSAFTSSRTKAHNSW